MRNLWETQYIVASDELMWLVVGFVAGVITMAFIDFIIDRSKK